MYSLFLLTSALSYLALLWRGRTAAAGGAGRCGRSRSWRRSRRTPTAPSCSPRRGSTCCSRARALARGVIAFAAVAVLGIAVLVADLVLAGRFDVGVGGGGQKLGGPRPVLELPHGVAGDFTSGCHAGRARGPRARSRRRTGSVAAEPRRGSARRLRRLGADGRVPARAARQSASPESRHLIFVLPVLRAARRARAGRARRAGGRRVLVARARRPDRAPRSRGARRRRLRSSRASPRRGSRRARPRPRGSLARRGRRRPLRLRPALPRRLGARPHWVLGDRDPARRRQARAEVAPGGPDARPRRLGLRRERHEQLHAEADDSAALPASQLGLRGARLRTVPRRPRQAADA